MHLAFKTGTTWMNLQKKFAEIHSEYMQRLQQALVRPDDQARVTEAHNNYMRVMQEVLSSSDFQRVNEAYRAYLETTQKAMAPDDIQQRVADAFRVYARELKTAWSEVDPAEFDPLVMST